MVCALYAFFVLYVSYAFYAFFVFYVVYALGFILRNHESGHGPATRKRTTDPKTP
jgi:hypothetical protein